MLVLDFRSQYLYSGKALVDSWPSVDALLSGGDHRQEEDGGNLGT